MQPKTVSYTFRLCESAFEIIQTLQNNGYEAYAVGGCIRDQLLGKNPKDFDIVTNATPEQIQPLFRRCILIGKRFRLAHVYINNHYIEVATFRGHSPQADQNKPSENLSDISHSNTKGIVLRDNHFGNIEEDAVRRDFTINALFYDPIQKSILDFCNGLKDIKNQKLNLIGEPLIRFQEDPVRILRAIRFSVKLNLTIPKKIIDAIHQQKHLLAHMPSGRLFDEYTKLFLHGHAYQTFHLLQKLDLLKYLFPQCENYFNQNSIQIEFKNMLNEVLKNTDIRILNNKGINPIFLVSVFLWPCVQKYKNDFLAQFDPYISETKAINLAIENQLKTTAFPRRFSSTLRHIWHLQRPLLKRRTRQVHHLIHHPKFRAAYDFLLIRANASNNKSLNLKEAAEWWTEFQTLDKSQKIKMVKAFNKSKK